MTHSLRWLPWNLRNCSKPREGEDSASSIRRESTNISCDRQPPSFHAFISCLSDILPCFLFYFCLVSQLFKNVKILVRLRQKNKPRRSVPCHSLMTAVPDLKEKWRNITAESNLQTLDEFAIEKQTNYKSHLGTNRRNANVVCILVDIFELLLFSLTCDNGIVVTLEDAIFSDAYWNIPKWIVTITTNCF